MAVYSPSQTERFIRCPRLWDYNRRWTAAEESHWLEKAIGTAMHAGIAAHYRADGEDYYEAAYNTLRDEWPIDTWPGPPLSEMGIEAATERVSKAVKRALGLRLGEGATILHVESELGEEKCRLDLSYQDERGITIVDWKYAHNCGNWVLQKRLDEAKVSWQLRHYAWRVQQAHPDIPVVEAGQALIVGGPMPTAKWMSFEVTPALITDWAHSADRVWTDIGLTTAGILYPTAKIGPACLMYGGCPYYDGCHVLMGDESRFHTLYQAKEPQ